MCNDQRWYTRIFSVVFNRSLEKDVVGDTSGLLRKILLALLQGQRPDSNEVNEDEAENDARTLFEAGEKKWGTDEAKFVDIISSRRCTIISLFIVFSTRFFSLASNAQLKAIYDAYGHFSKKDIETAIKSETSGNLCRALLAIGKNLISARSNGICFRSCCAVRVMRSRPYYFANQLKKALKVRWKAASFRSI